MVLDVTLMLCQALENSDAQVTAKLLSQLTDASVGMAGRCELGGAEQSEHMRVAEKNAQRSYEGEGATGFAR